MTQLLAEITARAALPLGLLFLITYNVWVLKNLHRRWLLLDLLGLFAVLQLWVAPALRYHFEALGWTLDPNNNMAVPPEVYFPVVIPMVLALVAGIRIGNGEYGMFRIGNAECGMRNERGTPGIPEKGNQAERAHSAFRIPYSLFETFRIRTIPYSLFGLGLVGMLAYPFAPSFLKQPCVLLKGLLWVSAACGFPRYAGMTRKPLLSRRELPAVLALIVLVLDAVVSTFFGTLVLGLVFLGMVWLADRPVPWRRLLVVQFAGALLVVFLLSFKFEYRKAVKSTGAGVPQRFGLFFTAAWDAVTPPYSWLGVDVALERLNQGMHVSHVLAYVPAQAPYGYGRELGAAFLAAFVPRALWPNKHRAGGQENRERFLGVPKATYSYNIGAVGEAYAHFGRWGWMYTFVYAWSLSLCQNLLLRASLRWFAPLWLFSYYLFAPALLLEGDSGIVWNHLVKAGMVVVGVYYVVLRLTRGVSLRST